MAIFFPGGILNHILQVSIRLFSNVVIDKANQPSDLNLLNNKYFWNQFSEVYPDEIQYQPIHTRTMLIRYHNGRVVNHSPDLGKVVSRPSSDWGSSLLVSHYIKYKKHEKLLGLCFLVITQASDLIVGFSVPLADGSGSGNLTTLQITNQSLPDQVSQPKRGR